ncbi:MAG: thrombospondin type 3 repeat-containing protein [Deltaproteobacteria bacterium]|nr:thrombospondin type 3 repeat-containing protein [Deltaproteobacteria bacterium]
MLAGVAVGTSGCIEDSDCGICDPDNLRLESISGINYASRKVNLLNPDCEGPECPGAFNTGSYFIQEIGPCEETEEALESPRGVDEFCKISPLVTAFGIEFVFNNLLDPTSIELVRKRPDNPQLFEVYDWKFQVLDIEGPLTRFNGDFVKGATEEPDVVTRLVNLSCIDNLRDEGLDFGHEDYQDPAANPCNAIGANGLPRKMRETGTITSYTGRWTVGSNSCETPEEGPDTCCSRCDYLLSTQVAKYGLTAPAPEGATLSSLQSEGLTRNPNTGTGIICDPAGDTFSQCADFIPWVGRSEQEIKYRYYWECDPATDPSCQPQEYSVPYYDQLRETHPDQRPEWLERRNASCVTVADCRLDTGHALPGTDCVGITGDGLACDPETAEDGTCTNGRCVAEWFVTCRSNTETTGDADPNTDAVEGFCTDQRFSDGGAGACLRSRGGNTNSGAPGTFDALCDEEGNNCSTAPGGTRLAFCDHDENGTLLNSECCQETLQAEQDGFLSSCDPYTQDLNTVSVYDRSDTLPEPTKNCICPSGGTTWGEVQSDDRYSDCVDSLRIGCFFAADIRSEGNGARAREERANQYAVKFVSRVGGVVYDPAIKGFEWRPADVGGIPRADIESCAETRGLIDDRNAEDGWRSNDAFFPELIEDYDRGLCSDATYTVNFRVPDDGGEFVKDKVGNTLAGKSSYTFQTPEFHVEPGSGFPSDNLRIGACNDFSLRFSNKYDMSPENVSKVEVWKLVDDPDNLMAWDQRFERLVAGGADCAETKEALEAGEAPVPCLTIDIGNQGIGEIGIEIDPTVFGPVLRTGETYRIWVPGLSSREEMNDPAAYQRAFWDVCGMPLITTGGTEEPDFLYDFTVDQPKCKEDQDLDGVQLSCDNAPDFFNPDQGDIDSDGFGDVIDLCPTLAGSSDDTADSDDDGVGNECDTCRQASRNYNEDDAAPMGYMAVRNVPFQDDTDGDGIGDVCDNCVRTANCNEYGPDNTWSLGDPIDYDDDVLCQLDSNSDMVGDACEGDEGTSFAAGAIGIGPDDDFDQDGLINTIDACPRQPVALVEEDLITCASNDDCPNNRRCEMAAGVCDHLDTDADGVGDACDTCPFVENPLQVADGAMQEGDDTDGDYVGNACETHPSCENRVDSRPLSFYDVSANGYCCTVALFADENGDLQRNLARRNEAGDVVLDSQPLLDPLGLPVRENCSETEEGDVCRKLPASVALAPGILTPPAGCEEALDGLDPRENPKLRPSDFDDDLEALWSNVCFLPQFDQDYDGLGDQCDLCEFDFDPENQPFIDTNGRVWPNDGRFCNGEFSVDNKPACQEDDEPAPTGGEETEGGASTGEEMTGGGASSGGSGG